MENEPDDSEGTQQTVLETGGGSNLREKTFELASKHAPTGDEPKKRGRPRGPNYKPRNRYPSADKVPDQSVPDNAPVQSGNPPVAPVPIDPALVTECVKAFVQAVDSTIRDSIQGAVFKLTNDKNMADGMSVKAGIKPTEMEMISKLAGQVCVQYQVAGQHAPLIFLTVFTASWATRVIMVRNDLKRIAKIVQEANVIKSQKQ